MDIEQKLEEVIGAKLMDGYQLERTFKCIIKSTTKALLTSTDIAVVEKGKLEKMKRVVEAARELKDIVEGLVEDGLGGDTIDSFTCQPIRMALKDLEVD